MHLFSPTPPFSSPVSRPEIVVSPPDISRTLPITGYEAGCFTRVVSWKTHSIVFASPCTLAIMLWHQMQQHQPALLGAGRQRNQSIKVTLLLICRARAGTLGRRSFGQPHLVRCRLWEGSRRTEWGLCCRPCTSTLPSSCRFLASFSIRIIHDSLSTR
jgi:hypothetical protein